MMKADSATGISVSGTKQSTTIQGYSHMAYSLLEKYVPSRRSHRRLTMRLFPSVCLFFFKTNWVEII